MRRTISLSILAIMLVMVTVALTSCFGPDREHLITLTAPDVLPESTEVEVCEYQLAHTPYTEESEQLSVAYPRRTFEEGLEVPCDKDSISNLVTVINDAGNDAAFVEFLETAPGTTPYRRYYFADMLGDTLQRPEPASGSTTVFNLLAMNVPAGHYQHVGLYKGTVRLANSTTSASPYAVYGTQWHITRHAILSIFCKACRIIKVPKP